MKIKGSTILVTGGAGFIGSHIVESLISQDAEVKVFDNFSSGIPENLSLVENKIEIIQGDILDFEALKIALKKVDIVSHQAAQLEIFLSSENPYKDLEINTVGTLNILRASIDAGVYKVINASSACVYGQTNTKTDESFLPVPNWAYGISKLAAERYGTLYSQNNGLPVVNLRYGIVYGEREWYRRVLTIFIKRALLGEPLVIFGDGKQIRDFVYVKDVVEFHNQCIENEISNGHSYNVGTGIATSITELANIVSLVGKEITGKSVDIIFEDPKEGEFSRFVPDKKRNIAELKMMQLDITKGYRDLEWKPTTSLQEGIKNEMLWASQNLNRWEVIHYSQ